jgi:hypothetical protein
MSSRNPDERQWHSLNPGTPPCAVPGEGTAMTRYSAALRLLAAALGAFAVMATSASAFAQPEPPPVPSLIDQLVSSSSALSVNPTDDGSASTPWGGVGMICQNFGIRCR